MPKIELRTEDLALLGQAVDIMSAMTFKHAENIQRLHMNRLNFAVAKKDRKRITDEYVMGWDMQMGYYFRLRRISDEIERIRRNEECRRIKQ